MELLDMLFTWAGTAVTAMVLAWVAGLVLGLRVTWPRALLAGFIGFSVGGVATELMKGFRREDMVPFGVMVVCGIVLVTMAVLVAAEALFPVGTRLRPLARVRGGWRLVGRARRYAAIVRIAARHGLWPYLYGRRDPTGGDHPQRRLARSMVRALEEGGVTFVKLGQVLATRRDLLSPVFVQELGRLHHQVAPVPWERLADLLHDELGTAPEEVFAEFDRTPLAAASIAQAHRARLRDGTEVVVKVQRPGIEPVVRRDLDIVRRLARTLEARTDWAPALGVRELADGFADALLEELDFEVESANVAAVAAASAGSPVRVPTVCEEFTTRRVLVMEWLDGTPLGSAGTALTEDGTDGAALARTLFDCLLEQVMLHGIFHADPHPGNIMLLADGRLGLLDYGSVGRLDATMRGTLQRLLLAIDRGDPATLTDTLLELVAEPDDIDETRLRRALGQFMVRYLHEGAAADVRMFTNLLLLVTRHGLRLPAEIAAVFRALATIEGTLTQLSPGFDVVTEAKRFAADRVGEYARPEALRKALSDELIALLPTLRRLPRRLDRIGAALESGRLGVNVRLLAHPDDRRFLSGLVHQALVTLLAIAAGAFGVGLLAIPGGPALTPMVTLYDFLGTLLMLVGVGLVLRVLLAVYRRPVPPGG